MLASNWALLAGSLIIAAPVVLYKVTDHVSVEEDLKFSDETASDIKVDVEEKSANENN